MYREYEAVELGGMVDFDDSRGGLFADLEGLLFC